MAKNLKILIIIFHLSFLISNCHNARAEEIALTLEGAVSLALRENRDVLFKAEDVKKAKEKIAEAEAALFPALTVTATRADTSGYYTKDLIQTTAQGTLKQYLYKGGKTINTIKRDRHNLAVKEALLDEAKLETALDVKKAFYTLLVALDYANLNKSILENTEGHFEALHKRYEAGQSSWQDVLKLESSLSDVRQAYEASLNQIESARVLLNNLLYLDAGVRIKPDGKLEYDRIEVELDKAFLKAMQSRPEIRQYEAQEEADKKSVEVAKADNRPSVYASWDYYSRSHAAGGTVKNWNDYNIVGITFSWPVFDGWQTKAKVEQAIADLKMTQLNKNKAMKDIESEVRDGYLELKNAVSKIESIKAQVDLYEDALSVIEKKYKAGIASSLDLNDASLGAKVSLFSREQAIYDYLMAKVKFEKAAGG